MNQLQKGLIALVAIAAVTAIGAAETGYLNWTPPSQYTDGSLLAQIDIESTNLRCSAIVINGTRTGCSLGQVNVPGQTTTYAWAFSLSDPRGGQVCFQAQTVMVGGALSDWSNEACKTVVGKRPMPPVLVIK